MPDHKAVMRQAYAALASGDIAEQLAAAKALRAALAAPDAVPVPVADQPEALRLAVWLDHYGCVQQAHDAAACLRRQHALLHPPAPPQDNEPTITVRLTREQHRMLVRAVSEHYYGKVMFDLLDVLGEWEDGK